MTEGNREAELELRLARAQVRQLELIEKLAIARGQASNRDSTAALLTVIDVLRQIVMEVI
jgi:hypothetical protein